MLGIFLDNKWSYAGHIRSICRKTNQNLTGRKRFPAKSMQRTESWSSAHWNVFVNKPTKLTSFKGTYSLSKDYCSPDTNNDALWNVKCPNYGLFGDSD